MIAELVAQGKIKHALTANGKTLAESCKGKFSDNRKLILPFARPMQKKAGFLNIKGNLFDSAIMKTSVIMPEFRKRYLENPQDPMAFEGAAIVFDGPEDYHHRTDDPKMKIDANTMLLIRGVGPVGYPGAAAVVKPDSTIIVSRIGRKAAVGADLEVVGQALTTPGPQTQCLGVWAAHQAHKRLLKAASPDPARHVLPV